MLLGLQHLEVAGWGGIYSHQTKTSRLEGLSVRWRTGQSGAHRTVRCPLPRHHCRWILTVGASDLWARLDVRCTPDNSCSLSGAPVWARLTTARAERALNAPAGDRWRGSSHCSVVHRTVRCTPDSPVNYSGAASIKFPRLASSGGRASLEHRTLSGVHRTVR
jgi:hypothetical protein